MQLAHARNYLFKISSNNYHIIHTTTRNNNYYSSSSLSTIFSSQLNPIRLTKRLFSTESTISSTITSPQIIKTLPSSKNPTSPPPLQTFIVNNPSHHHNPIGSVYIYNQHIPTQYKPYKSHIHTHNHNNTEIAYLNHTSQHITFTQRIRQSPFIRAVKSIYPYIHPNYIRKAFSESNKKPITINLIKNNQNNNMSNHTSNSGNSASNTIQDQKDRLYYSYKTDVDNIIARLNYDIRLPPQFSGNFLRLGADTPTRDFLTESVRKFNRCFAINWGISLLRTTLAYCMNHTDIIGFLNVGLMHIISAKQLQLLLQHSYSVKQPINGDEFQKFNFVKWLESNKQQLQQQQRNILGGIFSSNVVIGGDGNIPQKQQQQRQEQQEEQQPVLKKKTSAGSSTSSTHRSLAGRLLGVEPISDNEDDDYDGHVRRDDVAYEQHKLNLDHIFGINTTGSPTNNPKTLNSDTNNNNIDIESNNTTQNGNVSYQTYQSVMFGSTTLPNCPDYLQDETLLPVKYGTMLDVGAGAGRMAELLSPVFDKIECTEVSEQMVKLIRSKGFTAHHVDNLDNMNQKDKYDVVCLFNLIDRCEEPISLLHQLHQRLRPQLQKHRNALIAAANRNNDVSTLPNFANGAASFDDKAADTKNGENSNDKNNNNNTNTPYVNLNGRVVIAVPLPLRPSVEMTLENNDTTWRDPKENIAMSKCWCCTSYEESLQHLIMNIIDPCGYDVLTVSRLPYLSEGNTYHSHFVLEDVILVCAPKPEFTP